jgi:hypothetical protein
MKNINYLFALLLTAIMFQSCATYNVAIMNEKGEVLKEHTSEKVYTGTNSFVIDAVLNPLVMVYSLLIPNGVPKVKSSIGVGGGISLKSYIATYYSLSPVSFGGGGGGNWVIFDANDGNEYSYSGYPYQLTKKTKFEGIKK